MFRAFAADADFALHFQPFQLYGDLPGEGGVDKGAFFLANSKRVRPDESDAERARRRQGVVEAWRREGLDLKDVYGSVAGGRVGNSLDAQRLILLARAQGREDACIEAIYAANHEQGRCLGDRAVLEAIATAAGVEGAAAMLQSGEGEREVLETIESFRLMGIRSVPVVILDGQYCIEGLPDEAVLAEAVARIVRSDQA